jgi:fibronectin type 3 domain-containing protein
MRRILVFVGVIASIGACVDLTKPEQVAECAKDNTCVNTSPVDGGKATADGKKDGTSYIEGSLDAGSPGLDAAPSTDDTSSINPELDGGELPDLSISDAIGPIPDAPVILGDGPANDAPVFEDVLNGGPDTRDANRDVAAGICATGGVIQPAGTVCRPVAGLCDIAETCDGVTADCPPDKLASAGTECRAVAGDCDIAETCTGTSVDCPADGFMQAGTVCRPVAPGNLCDVAESCTGTGAACPVDSLAPATTVCRASTDNNQCDPAELCTGASPSCPVDVLYSRPAVPGNVAAAPGTLQASISWSAATGATGYNVKQSTTSGSGYTTLGTSPTASASPYVDTGLTGSTTYHYVVSSIDTIATCESANSTEVSVVPAGACTAPSPPAISATPGNGVISLSWPAVTGAVSYSVSRKVTPGTADYAIIAAAITTRSYNDSAVQYGTNYSYVVTASNGTCSSGNSNAVVSSPLCTPPATAPTALSAAIPSLGGQVTLTWTGSADAQTYQILRKLHADTSYVQIGQVSAGTLTYSDSGLTNGQSYDYVVTSNNGTCASTSSNVVTAVPQCSVSAPVFQTPATVGDKEVDLSWSTSAGAINYTLSRKLTSGTTYAVITTPAITATSYADKDVTLVNGTSYDYVVRASNGNCASANSAPISATPICTPPSTPGTLVGTPGNATATLTWGASTPVPDSYTVQRKLGSTGTYVDLGTTTNGTTTSYADNTAVNDSTYFYRVRANKGSCSSGYDAEVSVTPTFCPQGASGTPTLTITSSTQIKVDWTASTPAPASYNIGRSPDGVAYTSVGSVGGATLTFTDPSAGLLIGATYYYQITAVGASCSTTSAAGSIVLACQTPGVPVPTATNSAGAISVSWPPVTGATAYSVTRSPCTGGTCPVVSANQTSATFTDPASGLTNGTTYSYQVTASNANHQCISGQSTAVSAMSCTVPVVPVGVGARRTGNKQVTISWTNSSGASYYDVLRSTTSGSGYASVGHAAGTPFQDNTAANGTVYYYVVVAKSDAAGNCPASGNSAQVSAPSCTVGGCATGTKCSLSFSNVDTRNGYCWITCDTGLAGTGNWNFGNSGTLYVNNATPASGTALPATVNSGLAFYFSPSTHSDSWYGMWNGTGATCP